MKITFLYHASAVGASENFQGFEKKIPLDTDEQTNVYGYTSPVKSACLKRGWLVAYYDKLAKMQLTTCPTHRELIKVHVIKLFFS